MPKHAALRKEQPDSVKRAISEGDKTLLSEMGRKGAMKANDNREARKAFDTHLAEQRDAEDAQVRKDTNEDIVPFDSDDERDAA